MSTVTGTPTTTPADGTDPAGGMPLPTRRNEAWRYAPHRDLARLSFGPPPQFTGVADATLAAVPQLGGPLVVTVNGVVARELSQLDTLPHGVVLTSEGGPGDHPWSEHAAFDADGPADAYVAMNRALAGVGCGVLVRAGEQVEEPIHLVHVLDPGETPNAACGRVRVTLGDGASATVVETHVGVGDGFGGANIRTTVVLGERAALEHLVLQDLAAEQVLLSRLEVVQRSQSRLRVRSFNLGGRYGRIDTQVDLAGEGAEVDLAGLYFGTGEQVLDQQLEVVHRVGNCTSRQSYRGVLDDASTGVFSGGIDVRPGADGTDASQSNDNLLLSRQAEVDTQPRLEILADDVVCQHGATVGQLDPSAVFYLRSRGLSADEAARVLVNAFADQVVDEVGHDAVCTWLARRLGHDHD